MNTVGRTSVGRTNIEEEQYVCQAHYERSTADGGPPVTFCDDFSEGEFSLPECTSSVQEIEQCLEIDIARSSEIVNGLRYCGEIDHEYIDEFHSTLFREMRVPEGCRSVWQNCQQVLR